jgi:hypothetical protein
MPEQDDTGQDKVVHEREKMILHPYQNVSHFDHFTQIKKSNHCCMEKRNYELVYTIVPH